MLFLIFFFNPSVTTCHLPYIFALFFQPPCPSGTPPIFCVAKTPRHAAGHGKGEDCATKDFLSLPKKVLVTLIRFICSFFSTARRTNQEAPPLLSGFWVRRRGRRRGLRNSLRSDSPRPFSSVFLATSPPDKGGDFARAFAGLFNPLALWALPLYRCAAQGERDMHHSVLVIEGISPSPLPCPVASRDIALKSKQEQKAKTIQQKGIDHLLCARMCDRGGVRKDGGGENAIISACLYRIFNPLALWALPLYSL